MDNQCYICGISYDYDYVSVCKVCGEIYCNECKGHDGMCSECSENNTGVDYDW